MDRAVATMVATMVVVAAVVAGCGVEDLGPETAALGTTTTTAVVPTVLADTGDALVDVLLGYGYDLAEARCGADGLRGQLDAEEVDEVVRADDTTDVDRRVADVFSAVLTDCVND